MGGVSFLIHRRMTLQLHAMMTLDGNRRRDHAHIRHRLIVALTLHQGHPVSSISISSQQPVCVTGTAPPLQQPVIHPHSNGQTTAAAVTAATIPVIMAKTAVRAALTVVSVPLLNTVAITPVTTAKRAIHVVRIVVHVIIVTVAIPPVTATKIATPVLEIVDIVKLVTVVTSPAIMENHAIPVVRIVGRVPFAATYPVITAKTVTPVLETAGRAPSVVMECVTIGKHVTLVVRIAVYASSAGTGSVITEKPVCIVHWIAANVSHLRLPTHRNRLPPSPLLNVVTESAM